MPFPRLELILSISERLNLLGSVIKTRSRANMLDANIILESITKSMFNALFGYDLDTLNREGNYPGVDLEDRKRRLAVQVTNSSDAAKIRDVISKAKDYKLNKKYKKIIVFFLLPKKPRFPRNPPTKGIPTLETLDISDLLRQMTTIQLASLRLADAVLKNEFPTVLSSIDQSKPQMKAKFYEKSGRFYVAEDPGEPVPSYYLEFWIEGAPRRTRTVTYEILDAGIEDGTWSVERGNAAREFVTKDDLNSYGDYMLCVRGRGIGDGNWFLQSTLYDALERHYGPADDDTELGRAMAQIRAY